MLLRGGIVSFSDALLTSSGKNTRLLAHGMAFSVMNLC